MLLYAVSRIQMNLFRDINIYLNIFQTYIGRRLYYVFGLTLFAALSEGLGIVMLLPLLETINTDGVSPEDRDVTAVSKLLGDLLGFMGLNDSIIAILFIIGLAFFVKGIIRFCAVAYMGYLRAQLMKELKAQLFDAYSSMSYLYYMRRDTGHFINIINTQIHGFLSSFESFVGFLSSIIQTVSYFGLALFVAWQFGAMALIVGLVILLLFQKLNSHVRNLSRQTSTENGNLSKLLIQTLQAFKYLLATNQGGHLRDGIMKSISRLTEYQQKQSVALAFTTTVMEPVSVFFIILIIAIQIIILSQPLAPIMVSIILFHRGLGTVITIQGRWQKMMNTIGSVEVVRQEFFDQRENREESGKTAVGKLSDAIECKGVSFAYDKNSTNALTDISFIIPACATVAFVGESGAGKSTIVDILTLVLEPDKGEVIIDGVLGTEIESLSWRSQIGYVSQDAVVFDDTIENNIALWAGDMGADTKLRERVCLAARQANISQFIEELPDGYNTIVGDRGVRLSGGQRQRLFIAREMFKGPDLLILDEATSSLDSESEFCIQQSIDGLRGQMTVIIIAHRLATIRNVDHVYVLQNGRILESGKYSELRDAKQSRLRSMIELQNS